MSSPPVVPPDDAGAPDAAGPGRAGSRPAGRGAERGRVREWVGLVVTAVLILSLMQTFVARIYVIPSRSMEQTLRGCPGCADDHVLADRLSFRFGDPEPGDVVVFAAPPGWRGEVEPPERPRNPVLRWIVDTAVDVGLATPPEGLVKRVIAVGGQTVACCDDANRVLVDGRPLTEPYLYFEPDVYPRRQQRFGPVRVPDGQLWMMATTATTRGTRASPVRGPSRSPTSSARSAPSSSRCTG